MSGGDTASFLPPRTRILIQTPLGHSIVVSETEKDPYITLLVEYAAVKDVHLKDITQADLDACAVALKLASTTKTDEGSEEPSINDPLMHVNTAAGLVEIPRRLEGVFRQFCSEYAAAAHVSVDEMTNEQLTVCQMLLMRYDGPP